MNYIEIEKKIVDIMKYFPLEVRETGDYDIPFLVLAIAEPYELSYLEIGGIYEELYRIFTGEADTNLLSKRIKDRLAEDHKDATNKIVDELETKVITPVIKILGDKFPIPADEEDRLDKESILSGIESPSTPRVRVEAVTETRITKPSESEIVVSGKPSPISHEVKVQPKPLVPPAPQAPKIGSIADQKMTTPTSLPKVETRKQVPEKPIQKNYGSDPYREPLK